MAVLSTLPVSIYDQVIGFQSKGLFTSQTAPVIRGYLISKGT